VQEVPGSIPGADLKLMNVLLKSIAGPAGLAVNVMSRAHPIIFATLTNFNVKTILELSTKNSTILSD
jgi:hypothetical protein